MIEQIEIGDGIIASLPMYVKQLDMRPAVIGDEQVALLYQKQIEALFRKAGMEIAFLTFPPGEENKNRQTKERLEDQLFSLGYGRDSVFIAIGGGVTTDLVGYLASTYCRGVPLIIVPTTLMGMVDAAIGGKNGVDTPFGKNLVGTFYPAKKVVIDLAFVETLPLAERKNGLVEMIKHGLIADASYFTFLEEHVNNLFDKEVLLHAIKESCRIKSAIVGEDRQEGGKRRLLNCGHTIGHAVEALSHYQIPHGHAVAIGIIEEGKMAVKAGVLKQKTLERIKALFSFYDIPFTLPKEITWQALQETMVLDKKSKEGKPRFVFLQEIGMPAPFNGEYCTTVDLTKHPP